MPSAPDVKIPLIQIVTTYEGVSPEDVENTVTKEIEKELAGLKGLKEMTSTTSEGVSNAARRRTTFRFSLSFSAAIAQSVLKVRG